MTKAGCVLVCLGALSGTICAEQTDSCAGLAGFALTQCRTNQQTLRQQAHLEQLLEQQQERQNELATQQKEVQQQLDSMRLQNESLRKQLERQAANPPPRVVATESAASTRSTTNDDVKSWRADNPWYGSDYRRTQFATHYLKQLQQERPDLSGRQLLDALSMKVNETFSARH
jgi:hypothetical protein